MLYLVPIDLNSLEIRNVVIHLLGSDPGSPVEGQIWYNTTGHTLKLRINGSTVDLQNPTLLNSQAGSYYLARANHTGTQLASTISNFDTQVRTSTLNQMAAPTADLSINSNKLTNVTDGTAASDAATKGQLDAAVNGFAWKQSVRAASIINGALATAFENGDTIDGVSLVTGNRILLRSQTDQKENGIYTVNASGAPTRATDADSTAELENATVMVEEGSTMAGSAWNQTTDGVVIGTNNIVWVQFGSGQAYTFSAPLLLTGNNVTLPLNARLVNNAGNLDLAASIVTPGTYLGRITVDTYGRTTAGGTIKYTALIGNGSSTSFNITQGTHGLAADGSMVAQVFDASSGAEVQCDITINNSNGTVTFAFAVAPGTNAYRIVIIG